jgi:hypothetical protein
MSTSKLTMHSGVIHGLLFNNDELSHMSNFSNSLVSNLLMAANVSRTYDMAPGQKLPS